MRKRFPVRNVVRVILIVFIILLIAFFSLNYTINNNDSYLKDLSEEIASNYKLNDNIINVNVYGGYYIVETKDEVIVLDKEYEEIFKENSSKLNDNKNNYDLVYKNNRLMYEETIVDGDTLTYYYYDAYSYEKVILIEFES